MADPAKARRAAEELGAELAKQGAQLQVYGGPYVEADCVRGFANANPRTDHSILMWYTEDQKPPPFKEESTHPSLFTRHSERGADWEVAFYRSIGHADGVIFIGGNYSTHICGQVAVGSRMPILCLPEFGGAAARVWQTLSAGEDLPTRDEIDLMARPWGKDSASRCVSALLAQHRRRRLVESAPPPILSVLAAVLFLTALAIVPWIWGRNVFEVWMLFVAPVIAGGAGATIRPLVNHLRGTPAVTLAVVATVAIGLVVGGIAGVLFVTAQLTADPQLANDADLGAYSRRSIPFAVIVGFISGLTADAVFGKLLGMDVTPSSAADVGIRQR